MWTRNRYTGHGGGLYTGPEDKPYMSNCPPRDYLLNYMQKNNMIKIIQNMIDNGF
ncbi:MAG: hypothetical protein K0S41_1962 [Anaerocolumna sp.]|nr:hypothetical protein [Anaerocolumna sp.]